MRLGLPVEIGLRLDCWAYKSESSLEMCAGDYGYGAAILDAVLKKNIFVCNKIETTAPSMAGELGHLRLPRSSICTREAPRGTHTSGTKSGKTGEPVKSWAGN